MNIQGWFPLRLTDFISLQSKGLLKSSPAPQYESIDVDSSTIYNSQDTEATQVPINRWMQKEHVNG